MRLILIRHGKPDELDVTKLRDPGLNFEGQRHARLIADVLVSENITHIISSPMQRARETAHPLALATNLNVNVVEGWAEADRETVRYRSTETLRAQGAEEWQKFLSNPISYLGADPETFSNDVLGALNAALSLPLDSRVAIFTHGMTINTVLSHLLGLPSLVHFSPGYGSLTRLGARTSSQVGIVSINELGHQNLRHEHRLTEQR